MGRDPTRVATLVTKFRTAAKLRAQGREKTPIGFVVKRIERLKEVPLILEVSYEVGTDQGDAADNCSRSSHSLGVHP